jgi:predicted nucleic acid-binding protein
MNKLIYTYSLVKTLYEQGKDYIDSFWPFVLKIMPKDKTPLNLDSIQKEIKKNFGLDIPQHSLEIIITRAKRKDYMIQQKRQFRLTNQGDNYLNTLEPESEVERRINELLEDIKNYLNEQLRLSLTSNETYDVALFFIQENINSLVEFFNPDSSIIQLNISKPKTNKYDDVLVNYFEIAKQRKPHLYYTLTDIVYGSVISTTASSRDIDEMNKKFEHTQLFLDSNYLFNILELQFPEFNKPAKELFNLLKLSKFELRVFDFTIDEMVRVLKNYSREQHLYISDVRVNSIYSNLKSQRLTIEDVREFITKIESKILELGIKIEPTSIDLKDYKSAKDEYRNRLSQYKPDQNLQSQNHDLAAVEKIREIRRSPKREIESSKALFLTSDLKLSKFDFLEMGHREKATVCEVIPDRLLTNILWLKNPSVVKDIPLKSIIAVHSREMFIDRKIWRRFCETITKLKGESSINDKDVSMLFYNHYIEEVLKNYDESQIDNIAPNFILEKIQAVSKLIDDTTKSKLEEQKGIFEKQLAQKELDKGKELVTKISEVKKKIKARAVKRARRLTIVKMYTPFLIFVGVFVLFILTKGWGATSKILGCAATFLGILSWLGIKVNILKIQGRLQDKTFQKIYSKELSELALEENKDRKGDSN